MPAPKGYIGLYELAKTLEKFAIFLIPQILANQTYIASYISQSTHLNADVVAGVLSLLIYTVQQFGKGQPILTTTFVQDTTKVIETVAPQTAHTMESVEPVLENVVTNLQNT